MWFALNPADLSFTVHAPFRFDTVALIEASPERVFEAFAHPADMARFIAGFRRCEWTSPPPNGVGSMRQLDLWGLSFREHFIAWEPGRRICFAIDATTLPLMQQMVEDLQFDPVGTDKTRLIWSVHYAPSLLIRLTHPFARFGFEQGYRQSVDRLRRFVLGQPGPSTLETQGSARPGKPDKRAQVN